MGYLLLFLPLLFIAYEDFRYRAIHWVWLVVLTAGVLSCYQFDRTGLAVNLLLMGFQLAVLTLYFSVKEKQLVFLPKRHLGWGDILFYVPLCLLFSPMNLILFLAGSFVVTLLAYGLYNAISKHPVSTIPLAGCLAGCLIAVLAISIYKGGNLRGPGLFISILKNTLHP